MARTEIADARGNIRRGSGQIQFGGGAVREGQALRDSARLWCAAGGKSLHRSPEEELLTGEILNGSWASRLRLKRAFLAPAFPPYLGPHVQRLDLTVSNGGQFSIEVGGEVVGQEVRSGQARVLVQGLLCDLKAHGGVRNSSQKLLQEKGREER